jgi:two-component system, response regulator PdtaR
MVSTTEPSLGHEGARKRRIVLIIEDDFLTRYSAAEYLREKGFRVIEAENAAEAISVLVAGTCVDVVFSDINMPGSLNGLGFGQWLAEFHPGVPLLLTSGAPQEAGNVATCKTHGFIAKPYDLDEVDRWIKAML